MLIIGSKTSSKQEFLEQVKPNIALIGVGKKNHFGHPSAEVITKLNNLKCTIYRTDENGEIQMQVTQNNKIKIFPKWY